MIDATVIERAAMAAALHPLGEFVAQVGLERPLADYTREQILTLVEVIVDAYHNYLVEAAEREATHAMEQLHRIEHSRVSPTPSGVPF